MEKEKVTRDDLRAIQPGQSVSYEFADPKKCLSVRAMASWLNSHEGLGLKCSGEALGTTITVTRKG